MPLIRHPSLGGQRARKLMNQRSVGDVDAAARNRSMTHGDKRNVVVSYSFDDGIVSSASPKSNPKTDTEDSEGIPEPYVPLPLDTKEDVDREQPEVEETGEACGAASAESEKEGTAVKRSSKSKTSAAKKKKGTIGRKLGSSGRDKDKKRAKLEDLFDMNDAANYDSAAQYYQIRRLIVHRSTMEVRSNASTSATPPGPSPLEARVVAETLSGGRKKSFSHRSAPIQAEIASSCIVGSVLSSMPTGENGTPLFLSEVHAFFATHSVDMANARLCQLGLKSAQVQLFLRDLEANLFTISDLSRWISTWKAEAPLEPIVEEPAVAESEDKDAVGVAGAVSGEVLPPQFQKKNSTFKRGWDTIRMKKKRKSSAFPSNSVLDKEPWMSFTWKDFVTEIGELISAILLLFLEKMPKALMTDSYDRFANVVLCVDEAFKEEFTRSLIFALPVQNRKCLQTVLEIINEMEAAMETPSQTVAEKQCYYCRTALLCNIFGDLLFRQRTASTEAQINKCDMGDCEKESAKLCNSGLIVRYLVDNWKELFLVDPACDGIIYEIRNGKALVKAAQIEKIIVKLLDPWSLDKNFVDIVFLTHHYFIPSCELLELLVARYDAESEQKWKIQMRMRVLGLLRMWLEDQQLRLRPEQQFAELLQKYVNEWSSHSKIPGEVRLMKSLLLPFNTPLAEAVIFPELCKATSPLGEDSQPYSYSIVPMLSPRASVNYSPQNAGTGSTKKPHLSRTSSDSSIVEKRTVRREKPSPDLARKAGRSGTKSGKAGSLMKSTRSVRASHNDSESPGRASSPGSGGESRRTSGGKSSEINEGGTSKPFTFPGKALIVVKVSESKLNLRWNFTEKTPIRSQSWALYGRIAGEEEWKVYDYRSKRFVIMRERSFSIPGDQYRCTVQGLESDTQYELNIRFAVEGQGWGPKLKENISVTTLAGKSGLVKKLRKRTEIGGKKWNREKEKDSEKSDKEAEKDSEKDQKKLQEKIQETLEKSQEVNEDEAKSVEEKGVLADDDENLEESEGDEEEDGELAQLSKKCSSKSRLSIENPPESYMSDGEMGRSTPCSPQSRGDAYTPPLQTVSQHTKKGAFQKVISVSFISTDRKAAREAHPLEESKLAEASSGGDASPVSQCRTPDPTSLVASEGDRIEASLRASCGNRILESAKPKDLAETICVIDHRLLAAIPSHEFLKQSFMKPNMAPAFAQFVSCFNKWSMWACTEICHRTDTHYRSMMLDKVIRTAAKCLEYNNFRYTLSLSKSLYNLPESLSTQLLVYSKNRLLAA